MRKTVNKRRKFRFDRIYNMIVCLFLIMGLSYFATKIFVKSYNVYLIAQNQSTLASIEQVKAEVDTINVSINNLMDYNRVAGIVNGD